MESEEAQSELLQEEAPRRVVDINVLHSEIARYLNRFVPSSKDTARLSHTLFTGKSLFVPEVERDVFEQQLVRAYQSGTMPAIQEIHTLKFPMYLDMDMITPMQHVSQDAIQQIAFIMNSQVQKLFPTQNRLRLLICTKVRGGVPATAKGQNGLYKQGIHFHWPDLVVVVEKALIIRGAIIRGLNRVDFTAHLGINEPPWTEIVDAAVYRPHDRHERSGGLRLVGAPKAKKCTYCPSRTEHDKHPMCTVCELKNERHIVDDNVYALTDAVVNDAPNPELLRSLTKCLARMFRATSVRADDAKPETPGFVLYDETLKNNLPQDGRRKKGQVMKGESEKVNGRLIVNLLQITSPQVVDTMRQLLVQHSEMYKDSKMRIMFDGKSKYRVFLTGDGAHYCLNKKGFHNQEHVYMEVYKTASSVLSYMKCHSKKEVVYNGVCTCKQYQSVSRMVFRNHTIHLFPHKETQEISPMKSAEYYRLSFAQNQKEYLEKINSRKRLHGE